MEKVFQIFKAGQHTTMSGSVLDFSDETLRLSVAVYPPPSGMLAPLTLGHPADDLPVMGSVRRLFLKNSGLFAHADVSETLINLVRDGRYKNISSAFLFPNHPRNPNPGAYSLKHVGFLGANPPAVRGLEPLAFSEAGGGVICCVSGCDMERCTADETPLGFNVPAGWQVDPAGIRRYALAEEYRRGCPSLSFAEAVDLSDKYY